MKVLAALLGGTICWPFEALCAMLGLSLLNHEGFAVPTPGYLSCFVVVVGGELLAASVTMTREVRREMKDRADR